MKSIFLQYRCSISKYASFAEAIREHKKSQEAICAQATSDQIANHVIRSMCWNDSEVAILCSEEVGSESLTLHLWSYSVNDQDYVNWKVANSKEAFTALNAGWSSDTELVCITSRSVNGEEFRDKMDRRKLADKFIGSRIRRIVADRSSVDIQFQEERHYVGFSAATIKEGELPFLVWFEDED